MEAKKNAKLRRSLDHLAEITTGRHWTPIPEPLRSLWFDGKIPDPKVKLIMIMISHAANFHIKHDYLRKRFHGNTLKKYLDEIKEDGIIRVEQVRIGRGKPANVYHTNPVSEWNLRELKDAVDKEDFSFKTAVQVLPETESVTTKEIDEPAKSNSSPVNPLEASHAKSNSSPVNRSPVNRSPVNLHNKNKENQTKGNETNQIPAENSARAESRGSKLTKTYLAGLMMQLYTIRHKREVFTSQVALMLEHGTAEQVAEVFEKEIRIRTEALTWSPNHRGYWLETLNRFSMPMAEESPSSEPAYEAETVESAPDEEERRASLDLFCPL